jgi:ribonuclease HII
VTLRIGVDEAGLGPKLGPLGLSAFATEGPEDLRDALGEVIREPSARTLPAIEVGDSKKIHQGSRKLARLEETVLATMAWTHGGKPPASAAQLLRAVGFEPRDRSYPPWYADLDDALPLAADRTRIEDLGGALVDAAAREGCTAVAWRLDLIPASRFNRELRAECRGERGAPPGSKNTWVVDRTLQLVRSVFADHQTPAACVRCDKAGGRDRYTTALKRVFDEHAVVRADDGRERSHYWLESLFEHPPSFDIEWMVGGDREDPRISWASCLAKYARELAMRAFNRYWTAQIAELSPTAGYPQDARRFIAEVQTTADALGLPDERWIRQR